MFIDTSLAFSSFTTPQAVTTTADATTVIDITGAGSGNAPALVFGKNAVPTMVFGADWGSGGGGTVPYVYLFVTTAGSTANTFTVSLSGMIDNGSNAPGTATVMYQSAAFVGTSLTKGSVLSFQMPPLAPGQAPPRFYKLTYTCSGSLTVSVSAGIVINPQNSLTGTLYPNNFLAV